MIVPAAFAGVPDVSQSYFVPQAVTGSTLEGTAAIANFIGCPNNENTTQLTNGARLKVVVPVTILLIFVLLYLNFKSVTKSLIVLLSVPFVLAASSVILLMDGETAADFVNIVVPIMAAIVALLSFLLFWFNRKTPFKSLGFVFLVTFALFALGWATWTIYTEYVGEVSGIIISDGLWLTGYVMMIFIFAQVIRKTDIFQSANQHKFTRL